MNFHDSVTYFNSVLDRSDFGVFFLTNYRVLFITQASFIAYQMKGVSVEYSDGSNCNIPITVIDKVKRKKNELVIDCKDFRIIKLSFPNPFDIDPLLLYIELNCSIKQSSRFCFFNEELNGVLFSVVSLRSFFPAPYCFFPFFFPLVDILLRFFLLSLTPQKRSRPKE